MELKYIVESLINKASEGSYWDFKQNWYSNNADLLKDIICMANNTTIEMQDGYIIFGIEDGTFDIIGVSEDNNRKNQENIVGFLSSQTWSGEEIPSVDVKTIEISGKEIDVLIVYNSDVTPYYLLNDYSKTTDYRKNKTVIRAGVVYSRVGDRNTSSAECATKQGTEFLWKKRFGLVGSDVFKVVKRLKNVESWYSTDDYDTFYNSEYGDITIERDYNYNLEVKIGEGIGNTDIWVMDFPYLFTYVFNWNMGEEEIGMRAKWDVFLNGRKLNISLYGVQATRQTYYHIEPNTYWNRELGIHLNNTSNSIKYYAYIRNSVKFLAYNLFFSKQCYDEDQILYNRAFTVVPVFESEQEHNEFMSYVNTHKDDFTAAVEVQSIDEMFPTYSKNVTTVIIYKFGKTLVQWLEQWRQK
ncbi:putative DNA-binding protein [Alkalibaculum bacchi]|uniref:Putative DNA-binding protein n=1 Tax=Alkalibaculum bacchi TaxID=645887 RepID=A0A366HXL7_9FIRM|nr:ATP-binding protein [Alkalibaculum bacchi]RBP58448.1 putative DNA-binding protein [Alkalibaculum bacchi]